MTILQQLASSPLLAGLPECGEMVTHNGQIIRQATVVEFCNVMKLKVVKPDDWRLYAIRNLGFVFFDKYAAVLKIYIDMEAVTDRTFHKVMMEISEVAGPVVAYVFHQGWDELSFASGDECRQVLEGLRDTAHAGDATFETQILDSKDSRALLAIQIAAAHNYIFTQDTERDWTRNGIEGPHNIFDAQLKPIFVHPGVAHYVGKNWLEKMSKRPSLREATTAYIARMSDAYVDAIVRDKSTAQDVQTTFKEGRSVTKLRYVRAVVPMMRREEKVAVGFLFKQDARKAINANK